MLIFLVDVYDETYGWTVQDVIVGIFPSTYLTQFTKNLRIHARVY